MLCFILLRMMSVIEGSWRILRHTTGGQMEADHLYENLVGPLLSLSQSAWCSVISLLRSRVSVLFAVQVPKISATLVRFLVYGSCFSGLCPPLWRPPQISIIQYILGVHKIQYKSCHGPLLGQGQQRCMFFLLGGNTLVNEESMILLVLVLFSYFLTSLKSITFHDIKR